MLWACRWDKGYENCRLEDVPHRRLTNPAQVFKFRFDGVGKARGRNNLLGLEVVAPGKLNAVAFWFDLHLDEQCSLTTGRDLPKFASTKLILTAAILILSWGNSPKLVKVSGATLHQTTRF